MPGQHGIRMKGDRKKINRASEFLKQDLPESLFSANKQHGSFDVEFTGPSKKRLDKVRNSVIPTMPHHHMLKIIAPEAVDILEKEEIPCFPEKREETGEELIEKLIWKQYGRGKELEIDHIKAEGKNISLSPGKIIDKNGKQGKLVLR